MSQCKLMNLLRGDVTLDGMYYAGYFIRLIITQRISIDSFSIGLSECAPYLGKSSKIAVTKGLSRPSSKKASSHYQSAIFFE